jgi:type 1 glutamine amidotransferase
MRTSVLLLFTSVAFVGNAAPPTDIPAAEPLRLYVVTGGHDYHMSFYRLFENPDFRVNLHPHPGAFQGDLRGRVDVLVLYDMVQVEEIGDQGQKNLRDFLESGKGLVVLHHAIFDYGDWEWYWREVSGVRQNPNRDRSQPDYVHDVKLQIEPVATHPILSGIAPFQIIDETYKGLLVAPENTILLRTNHPTSDGPVAWISPYRKSRVAVIQLGHDEKAHLDSNYQKLVRNAILWAGGRLQ